MDQTQREFLVEIEELVERIFSDLDELRSGLPHGLAKRDQRKLIDRIFRQAHSIKGSAASSGLAAVSQIAHAFESLLDAVRGGQTQLDEVILNALESAANALSESLSRAASGGAEPSHQALFERLRTLAQSETRGPVSEMDATLKKIPSEMLESLTESEKQRLVIIVDEGNALFTVSTSFDMANFDQEFSLMKEKLSENGEIISTSPMFDATHPDKINFRLLYASETETKTLQASVIEFSNATINEIARAKPAGDPKVYEQVSTVAPALASVSSLSNFVRTDLEKLDRLISSTHELFRTTSNALDLALSQQLTKQGREELQECNRQIRNSFMSVEDEMINLRMISLGPILQRAARAGQTAARLAAKEIDFEILGDDVRLDKLLADAISDALIHLVRNAVDHGIETAEARDAAGKKRRGRIRIEAFSEGGQSRVRVTDDGRGIDPRLISEAATKLGIVNPDIELDIDRSVRLIFRPGFTTVDSASDVSGRGVGLDVVETSVEQVGGELRVSSAFGGGTTFEIRLPVTFGLLDVTVVVSGGNSYCIPSSQTLIVPASDRIERRSTGESTKVTQEEKLKKSQAAQRQLVSLSELLGQSHRKTDAATESQLISCQFSDDGSSGDGLKRIEITVDGVEGTQEVLVRNLGRHAGRWYGIAGATELRDGNVALVLDLPRLINNRTDSPE